MEIDTDDTEVLKDRLAEKSVIIGNLEAAFQNLEGIYKELQTVEATQIKTFETFKTTTGDEITTLREVVEVDKMQIENLRRKCEESEHCRALLATELE
eukprot:4617161-Heterocapsa_arctica.AAC.1